MAVSRHSRRSRFTLVLLILTSITLVTLDLRHFQAVSDARSTTLDFLAPVQDAASSAFRPISNAWDGAFGYGDLKTENERLRSQIDDLKGQLAENGDSTELLKRLTAQLDLPFLGDVKTLTARVVAGPGSNFDNTIELGKGRTDGIQVGMPVVTKGGLVGVIANVSDRRSVVTLVTDPGFRVGVRLGRIDQIGVARGQGKGRPLLIDSGIDATVKVRKQELVTTSGLSDSLFPPDVPVGKVLSSVVSEGDPDQRVFVAPTADVDALTFVDVMLWEPKN